VIVGRAQLIQARTSDSETIRSLRIIIDQAGRAHRILRDLMFVARAPTPRRRSCRPSELLSSCLHEHQAECAERGIRLIGEVDDSLPSTSADPEALRHLADILLRTRSRPRRAAVEFWSARRCKRKSSSGRSAIRQGLSTEEAAHLFDPFYCGREAGRGLGFGPAACSPDRRTCGGQLRWTSNPAHGTTFHVNLPVTPAVDEAESTHGPRHLNGHPVAQSSPKK